MDKVKKILITIAIIFSGAIFVGVLVFGLLYRPNGEVPATQAQAQILEAQAILPGHPIKFSIPTLNINTKIQEVGITKKGNIASPRNFIDVGWYKYGTLPGKAGTAIIDGHVDNGLAFPGVFSNLKNIQIGDDVYVETKESDNLHFVVSQIETYNYNARTNDIFIQSDHPRLVLITCTGNWIPNLRTHDKRLVVTATLLTS